MANTAFGHDATLTTPGSTTDTALVRWANTSGTSLNNTINILSDGSNITLNARGEVRFSDADSTHYIAFESPATVSTTYTMTLPAAVPSANDYLKVTSYSGAAGVLEWASVSADTNTTYTTSWVDSSNDAILRLTPSSGSVDDLTIVAGTNITLTPSGDNLTIAAAGGGTTVNGDTDNGIISWITSSNEFQVEPTLTYNGTTLVTGALAASSATVSSIEATTGTHNDRVQSFYVTAKDSGNMIDGFGPQIVFRATDSGVTNSILGKMSFERNGADNSGKFRLQSQVAGADNTVMIIYSTGEMQLPDQPAFLAFPASEVTNVTGDAYAYIGVFGNEIFDQGGNFDGTSTFTAPVDGRYRFTSNIVMGGVASNQTGGSSRIITSNRSHISYMHPYNNSETASAVVSFPVSALADMDAGDTATAQIYIAGGSRVADIQTLSRFAGELVT